ncbi:hypothetical protein ABZ070_00055 [Streptomyces sp. NPDC006283]|uniref:hypothetical protein n=1 Tax=Streptomyces sp. NPDC006283 TaxID=3156741 RepID=UPI00339F251A
MAQLLDPWPNLLNNSYIGSSNNRRYEVPPEAWLNLLLHLLVVAAAVAAGRYVRDVTAMQAAKLNALMSHGQRDA